MGKEQFNRAGRLLAILLVASFLISVTVASVGACHYHKGTYASGKVTNQNINKNTNINIIKFVPENPMYQEPSQTGMCGGMGGYGGMGGCGGTPSGGYGGQSSGGYGGMGGSGGMGGGY